MGNTEIYILIGSTYYLVIYGSSDHQIVTLTSRGHHGCGRRVPFGIFNYSPVRAPNKSYVHRCKEENENKFQRKCLSLDNLRKINTEIFKDIYRPHKGDIKEKNLKVNIAQNRDLWKRLFKISNQQNWEMRYKGKVKEEDTESWIIKDKPYNQR